MGCRSWFARLRRKKTPKADEQPRQPGSSSPPRKEVELPPKPVQTASEPHELLLPDDTHTEEGSLVLAREIWNEAYEKLRADASTRSLVDEYEDTLHKRLLTLGINRPQVTKTSDEKGNVANELANLDDSDRKTLLETIANERLEDIKKHSKSQQVLEAVVGSANKITSVVGGALAACPPASFAWSAVCMTIVPAIGNNIDQIVENQEGLNYVVSKLPWYIQLIDLLHSSSWNHSDQFRRLSRTIRDEIVDLYKTLILYQLQSFRSYRHPVATLVKNTVRYHNWKQMKQDIEAAELQLDKGIKAHHNTSVQSKFDELVRETMSTRQILGHLFETHVKISNQVMGIGNKMMDLMEDKERHELISKFKPDPTQLNLSSYADSYRLISRPHADTLQGIYRHPMFQQWKNSQQGLLVLAAHPGTGKSVLAKAVAESEAKGTVVCSFFFKRTGHQQNRPDIAAGKIFHEFLKQLPEIDMLKPTLRTLDKEEIRHDSDTVWNLISMATSGPINHSVTIVLDALDECDPKHIESLLQQLKRYHARNPKPQVRFLVTTRPIPSIVRAFDQAIILDMDKDSICRQSISKDINRVTRDRFFEFVDAKGIENEGIRKKLLERLERHNDSTYLYMNLLFQYLKSRSRPLNQAKWIGIFEKVPETVSSAYHELLKGVDESKRGEVRAMLEITLAATRPLHLREMQTALLLYFDEYSADVCYMSDDSFKKLIHETCGFLLDIYEDRIYFIHLTVTDYLLSNERPAWLEGFSIEKCHQTLAKCCTAYLTQPPVTDMIKSERFMTAEQYAQAPLFIQFEYQQWFKKFPFGEYAFPMCIIHMRDSQEKQSPPAPLDIAQQFGPYLDLVVSIFCSCALLSHIAADEFKRALPVDYPARNYVLSALTLRMRYLAKKNIDDINRAIDAIEAAVDAVKDTPGGHPDQANFLNTVAVCLFSRYAELRQLEDNNRAVDACEQGLACLPQDHLFQAFILNSLSYWLGERHKHVEWNDTDSLQDIKEAVALARKAVSIGWPVTFQPVYVQNLAVQLEGLYDTTGQIELLEEAIKNAQLATDTMKSNRILQSDFKVYLGQIVTI
ncbi:hypothetical protein MW887_004387 [Aspergillus wentii]|nr:hypothetical protein MW887_004387 [Aspergillus wentii]